LGAAASAIPTGAALRRPATAGSHGQRSPECGLSLCLTHQRQSPEVNLDGAWLPATFEVVCQCPRYQSSDWPHLHGFPFFIEP
jgi:hypothetical protein